MSGVRWGWGGDRFRDLGLDRGSLSLELAVLGPVLLLLFGLVVAAGRLAQAHLVVESAAGEAARAATAAADASAAAGQARLAAEAALDAAGLRCGSTSTVVDVSQWAVPVGRPARALVTVKCEVELGGLGLPGLAGSKSVTGVASSALDTYRRR